MSTYAMPRDCKTVRCLPIWPIAAQICARWLQQPISALGYVAERILMLFHVLAEAHGGRPNRGGEEDLLRTEE